MKKLIMVSCLMALVGTAQIVFAERGRGGERRERGHVGRHGHWVDGVWVDLDEGYVDGDGLYLNEDGWYYDRHGRRIRRGVVERTVDGAGRVAEDAVEGAGNIVHDALPWNW